MTRRRKPQSFLPLRPSGGQGGGGGGGGGDKEEEEEEQKNTFHLQKYFVSDIYNINLFTSTFYLLVSPIYSSHLEITFVYV